jgi:hypothetical protein
MEGTLTTDSVSDSDFLKEFYIPNYILVPDSKSDSTPPPQLPQCPVLVFINSKSGGQLGADLLKTYSSLLNENQVRAVRPFFFLSFCSLMTNRWFFFYVFNGLFRFLIWGRKRRMWCCGGFIWIWRNWNLMMNLLLKFKRNCELL